MKLTAVLAAALCAPALAAAQQYPVKPVRMVIHIGSGSSMDIVGRVLAQKLNETWSQPVIVDNRAGAGGVIGIDVVAKGRPDGYTILFGSSSVAIAGSYYRKLPYDTLRAVIGKISSDVSKLLSTAEMRERFVGLASTPMAARPQNSGPIFGTT